MSSEVVPSSSAAVLPLQHVPSPALPIPAQLYCRSPLALLPCARFKMGHFDPPEENPYSRIPGSALGDPRHRQLAAEAVSRSTVLLKNEVSGRGGCFAMGAQVGCEMRDWTGCSVLSSSRAWSAFHALALQETCRHELLDYIPDLIWGAWGWCASITSRCALAAACTHGNRC